MPAIQDDKFILFSIAATTTGVITLIIQKNKLGKCFTPGPPGSLLGTSFPNENCVTDEVLQASLQEEPFVKVSVHMYSIVLIVEYSPMFDTKFSQKHAFTLLDLPSRPMGELSLRK